MVLLTTAFALLAVVSACLGSSPLSSRIKHESRRSLPNDWAQSRRAPSEVMLPLRIGLAQSNIDRIEDLLLDISHPDSRNYGNHWSAAEVARVFRPSAETIASVRGWLAGEGISLARIRLSKSGGWIEANVSIAEAERLLKTEYHVYTHASTDTEYIACGDGYHVPEHVAQHIDLVTPTLHFDVKLKRGGSDKLEKRIESGARPGLPGFGPVAPKTTGSIEVYTLATC